MVSSPLLSSLLSFLHPHHRTRALLCSRVFSDTPSPALAFEAHLAEQLQKLTHSCSHENGSSLHLTSLNWMCKASDVVLSTHESVRQALIPTQISAQIAPSRSLHVDKVTQQHMEDIPQMLDACCLIKEALLETMLHVKACFIALKRIQRLKLERQGDVEQAVSFTRGLTQKRSLLQKEQNNNQTSVRPLKCRKRLQTCSSILRRMGGKLPAPATYIEPVEISNLENDTASMPSFPLSDALPATLYGAEMTTIFFLRLLSTAFSSSGGNTCRLSSLQLSGKPIWGPSLLELQARSNTKFSSMAQGSNTQRCVLPDLHKLDASFHQIYESLLQCKQTGVPADHVEHLVASTIIVAQQVERCLSTLHHHIQHIFSSLVDIRIAFLDSL
ncbi:hypothetical protein L7F22_045342 [Adiantum nelumboides]|nr:hypothetical protein [Adiantum nelumboides]